MYRFYCKYLFMHPPARTASLSVRFSSYCVRARSLAIYAGHISEGLCAGRDSRRAGAGHLSAAAGPASNAAPVQCHHWLSAGICAVFSQPHEGTSPSAVPNNTVLMAYYCSCQSRWAPKIVAECCMYTCGVAASDLPMMTVTGCGDGKCKHVPAAGGGGEGEGA